MTSVSRFPIALWPEDPVPVPDVERREAWLTKKGFVVWLTPGEPHPVAPELVLRDLLALDMADREAVVAFVSEHGVLPRIATVPGPPHPGSSFVQVDLTKAHGEQVTWIDDRVVIAKQFGVDVDLEHPDDPGAVEHVVEVEWWLRMARALARHWLAYLADERYLERPWHDEGFAPWLARSRRNVDAWDRFLYGLNAGLRAFTVRAEKRYDYPGGSLTQGAPRPDLYSALCLQLRNYIVEGLPPRKCASETCPNYFIRQLGGAEHGQYRTAGKLIYCSPACARRQTQRTYRRKQRSGA